MDRLLPNSQSGFPICVWWYLGGTNTRRRPCVVDVEHVPPLRVRGRVVRQRLARTVITSFILLFFASYCERRETGPRRFHILVNKGLGASEVYRIRIAAKHGGGDGTLDSSHSRDVQYFDSSSSLYQY